MRVPISLSIEVDKLKHKKLMPYIYVVPRDAVNRWMATEKVHHMFCMAHVLLGYHRDMSQGLFKLQKEYVEVNGPLGRDNNEKFSTYTPECVATRVARIASDCF